MNDTTTDNPMNVSIDDIRHLRSLTGAGIMDCKKALAEAGGDEQEAVKLLREKGRAKASKRAEKITAQGVVGTYLHGNKKVAGMVAVRCETDFVARSDVFQKLAKELAMQVVAMDPLAVRPEDVPEDVLVEEKAAVQREVEAMKKPEDIAQGIIEEKMKKFAAERSLLSQPFVKDPEITVWDYVSRKVSETGENITVGEFSRIEI